MSEVAGLKGGEEAACCARLCFHRGRGDEPSWAPGAWCWRLRMVSTILSALVVTAHSYVGGRVVFVRWDACVTCISSLIQNRENPCPPSAGPVKQDSFTYCVLNYSELRFLLGTTCSGRTIATFYRGWATAHVTQARGSVQVHITRLDSTAPSAPCLPRCVDLHPHTPPPPPPSPNAGLPLHGRIHHTPLQR